MSRTDFSVVIPIYNKRPHIRRAVDSVFRQSCQEFELILIDDASTDGSMDELKSIEDPRVVRARRETPGPGGYAARNLGVKMARGDWIAFLDADDEWNERILEEFLEMRESFPDARILCTGFVYKKGSREVVNDFTSRRTDRGEKEPGRVGLKVYLRETRMGRCPVHTSCVCMRKDLLEEIGGFPEDRCRRGGDRDTWLRAADRSDIIWSPYIGELYYCDSVNMVTKTVPEGEGCSLQTLDGMIGKYAENGDPGRLLPELRKLKQQLIEIRIKKIAKDGHLGWKDLEGFSFRMEPIKYTLYRLLALLPGQLIGLLLKGFLTLKNGGTASNTAGSAEAVPGPGADKDR